MRTRRNPPIRTGALATACVLALALGACSTPSTDPAPSKTSESSKQTPPPLSEVVRDVNASPQELKRFSYQVLFASPGEKTNALILASFADFQDSDANVAEATGKLEPGEGITDTSKYVTVLRAGGKTYLRPSKSQWDRVLEKIPEANVEALRTRYLLSDDPQLAENVGSMRETITKLLTAIKVSETSDGAPPAASTGKSDGREVFRYASEAFELEVTRSKPYRLVSFEQLRPDAQGNQIIRLLLSAEGEVKQKVTTPTADEMLPQAYADQFALASSGLD